MITYEKIQSVADHIAREFKPNRIILFGSYARGEGNENSDVDLFVEMQPVGSHREQCIAIRTSLWQNFKPWPFPMDIVVYRPEETEEWQKSVNSFASAVLRDGKTLYESGNRTSNNTPGARIFSEGGRGSGGG